MPPRLPCSSRRPQLLLNSLEQASASSLAPSAALIPLHRPTATSSSSACPTSSTPRCFSTTPARSETKMRREFKEWLKRNEAMLRRPPGETGSAAKPGGTYLGSDGAYHPFPNNSYFVSQPVLSERAHHWIWYQVMVRGQPLKAVSAQHGVDVRRVAAVVRLMEIEKRWEKENKPMATPYARALKNMLPTADLAPGEGPFEPINDIHVHSYTMQQLFVPTSESRQFTRADAAKAFGEHILPPDARMRIPELVDYERDLAKGVDPKVARDKFVKATAESERALAAKLRAAEKEAEERRIRVQTDRFEFRIEQINSEEVGPKGRARNAVGWRYGVPHMDRRRGEHKIPTSVGM
ncbi:hypothetical protein VTJ49DRAFT_4145 [Mycothermus thermophilus]|uniref:Uncharacterized protein n=1 Tax=Humicola insolens TaxID=85995 RepID=A0ABR3VMS9_HUMIN